MTPEQQHAAYLSAKKHDYVRALSCLAIELPEAVYRDASQKIRDYVLELEAECRTLRSANERLGRYFKDHP